MTRKQFELWRDGQPLVWLPASKLQPLLEASFMVEQQFVILTPNYRRHSPGATEAQQD